MNNDFIVQITHEIILSSDLENKIPAKVFSVLFLLLSQTQPYASPYHIFGIQTAQLNQESHVI